MGALPTQAKADSVFSEKKLLFPLQSALGLIYSKTEDKLAIIDIDSSDVGGAGRSTKVKVH